MLRALLLAVALWASAAAANAQIALTHAGSYVGHPSYQGPGDVLAGATGWYSCARSYTQAYAAGNTGKACNLRNVSSSETCDELLSSQGSPGLTANCTAGSNNETLTQFCATTCAVTKMYDQSGNGHDISQGTALSQPLLVVSGLGGLPHLSMTGSGGATASLATAGNVTPATGTLTLELVAQRSAGAGNSSEIEQNTLNNRIQINTANTWTVVGTGNFNATAADASWHAGVAVINGASSSINIDGTRTTGSTTTLNTTAGLVRIAGATSTTLTVSEWGVWDNVAFSPANQTSLCQNAQAAYGGGGNFGATC